MAIINYADKVALNVNDDIPAINKIEAGDMNEIKNAFNNQVAHGWYKTGINPTFTFVSYDSATLTGVVSSDLDMTPYLNVGMKVKFTQNSSIKYAFITAITSTQLTLFLGTDYSINNSAISNTYYSMLKAPYGFPGDPNIWTLSISIASVTSQQSPVKETWYNLGNIQLNVPIGLWKLEYSCYQAGYKSTAGNVFNQTALSTSINSQTNNNLATVVYAGNVTDFGMNQNKYDIINVTQSTLYYLIAKTDIAGMTTLYWGGNRSATSIKAICAYI